MRFNLQISFSALLMSTMLFTGAQEAEPEQNQEQTENTEAVADQQPPNQSKSEEAPIKVAPISDDVFIPTENVSEDYAVPFPTDI
ncbi:MAG: hypothetical protein F4W90_03600 [Gammaproteobacteria bacterium]|nr:hypothetical protein [Gammaproteobacteria bacterium]